MPPHILFWNDSLDFGFVSLSLSQTLVFCFANITLERTESARKMKTFNFTFRFLYRSFVRTIILLSEVRTWIT